MTNNNYTPPQDDEISDYHRLRYIRFGRQHRKPRKDCQYGPLLKAAANRRLFEGDPTEVEALQALYGSLEMDDRSNNWWQEDQGSTSICDFTGIECDDGYVTVLDLTSVGLTGRLPTEIGNLSKLERLALGNNALGGSVPSELASLTNLEHLELYRNELTGTILHDWSQMKDLKRLLVQSNQLTGTINASLCSLTKLKGLDLFGNPFTGSLPACLDNNLSNVRIHDTHLTGNIPPALCERPSMNGLSPNPFGCQAVACPVGTFASPLGRQEVSDQPCEPCPTATNLGSTTCPHTFRPTHHPTSTPTMEPPTYAPSAAPTATPSRPPSTLPSTTPSAKPSTKPTKIPSQAPTSSLPPPTFAPNQDTMTSNDAAYSPNKDLMTARPSPLPSLVKTLSPTVSPTPGDVVATNRNVGAATMMHDNANWTLLTVACILSILALTTVIVARRMGRKWWYSKHRHHATTAMAAGSHNTGRSSDIEYDHDDVSMESDSGWNDTESSVSSASYRWADNTYDANQEDEYSPWSVSLPAESVSTATTTTRSGSISRDVYW